MHLQISFFLYVIIFKYHFILVSIIVIKMMKLAESNNNIILFDMGKNEMFDINDNLKILRRKLKGSYTIAMQVTNTYN